jgi:hypothetical protein
MRAFIFIVSNHEGKEESLIYIFSNHGEHGGHGVKNFLGQDLRIKIHKIA